MRLKEVFQPTNVEAGSWTIAFPAPGVAERSLFGTYDKYMARLGQMRHTLVLNTFQYSRAEISDALLTFDLQGHWLALVRKTRDRFDDQPEIKFRFTDIEDADMFKLFGVIGTVVQG